MNLQRLSRWAAAGVLALAMIGGSALAQSRAPTKIKLGYSAATAFANAFVAADQGIFTKHGLDVEMILVPNSSTTPAALVSDSLQIATPTQPVTLQGIENGLDLVVLAGGGIVAPSVKDAAVMVREDSPIKTAKDFEGKKVANPGLNGFLHVMFREWMSRNGADWRKTTFVESPFAQLGDVLKAGQVDGILTADPFKTRIVESKQGIILASYANEVGDGLVGGWFVASQKWAGANREAAKEFQAAIAEATALAMKEPAILRKAIGVYTKLPEAAVAQILLPVLDDKIPERKVDDWARILVSQGILKKEPQAAKVIWK